MTPEQIKYIKAGLKTYEVFKYVDEMTADLFDIENQISEKSKILAKIKSDTGRAVEGKETALSSLNDKRLELEELPRKAAQEADNLILAAKAEADKIINEAKEAEAAVSGAVLSKKALLKSVVKQADEKQEELDKIVAELNAAKSKLKQILGV